MIFQRIFRIFQHLQKLKFFLKRKKKILEGNKYLPASA